MVSLTPAPKVQFFDANGVPLSGGKLYSYAGGTTTPATTYTSSTGTTANTNPIILDSRGEANVWLQGAFYKLALYSATDVLIWTVDNVSTPFATLAQSDGSSYIGFMPSGAGAVATTVQSKLRERVSVLDFGAVGNTSNTISELTANANPGTDDTQAFQNAIDYAAPRGKDVYVPCQSTNGVSTGYTIRGTLNFPYGTGLVCDVGAYLHKFDLDVSGSYAITIGTGVNNQIDGIRTENIYLYLRSGTACGIHIGSSRSSHYANTYIEGWIPPVPYTGIGSRTGIGMRIEANGGYTWFNTFDNLHINHVHTGIYALQAINGGAITQQTFNNLVLGGDSIYGDLSGLGMYATGCSYSIVNGGWIEGYGNSGTAAAFTLAGPSAVNWHINNVPFDDANIAMRAIRIESDGTGYPSTNTFENCFLGGAYTSIVDNSPVGSFNYIQGYKGGLLATAVRFPSTAVANTNANTLAWYETGSYTAHMDTTYVTVAQTITIRYTIIGNVVTLSSTYTGITGTSNNIEKGLVAVDMPIYLRPSAIVVAGGCQMSDNGGAYAMGTIRINTGGFVNFFRSGYTNWTTSGTFIIDGFTATYTI